MPPHLPPPLFRACDIALYLPALFRCYIFSMLLTALPPVTAYHYNLRIPLPPIVSRSQRTPPSPPTPHTHGIGLLLWTYTLPFIPTLLSHTQSHACLSPTYSPIHLSISLGHCNSTHTCLLYAPVPQVMPHTLHIFHHTQVGQVSLCVRPFGLILLHFLLRWNTLTPPRLHPHTLLAHSSDSSPVPYPTTSPTEPSIQLSPYFSLQIGLHYTLHCTPTHILLPRVSAHPAGPHA